MSHKRNPSDILIKLSEIHNNKYDYSDTKFTNTHDIITYNCPIHGKVMQNLSTHLYTKLGCPKCGKIKQGNSFKNKNRLSNKEILNLVKNKFKVLNINEIKNGESNILLEDKYGVLKTKVKYLKRKIFPTILSAINKTEYFINKAKEIHGDEYDYSKLEYIDTRKKVIIICNKHGEFKQIAAGHLSGNGCPICNNTRHTNWESRLNHYKENNQNKQGYLYLLKINNDIETFYKIGITVNNIKQRLISIRKIYPNIEILYFKEDNIFDLYKREQKILKELKYLKYKPLNKFCGHTECFKDNILNLIK